MKANILSCVAFAASLFAALFAGLSALAWRRSTQVKIPKFDATIFPAMKDAAGENVPISLRDEAERVRGLSVSLEETLVSAQEAAGHNSDGARNAMIAAILTVVALIFGVLAQLAG